MRIGGEAWSAAYTFLLLKRTGIRIAALALVMGALLFLVGQFYQDRNAATKLPLQISAFEEAIGYGGLIHHFKNYVLRPDEPEFAEMALASAESALNLLDLMAAEFEANGIDADLTRAREAVEAYAGRVPIVAEMRARGAVPREIDAAVRYDDTPALSEVAAFRFRIEETVNARLAFLRYAGLAMFLLALAGASIALFIALSEHQNSQSAFGEAREALRREKAGNDELRQFSYAVSHDLKAPMNTIHLLLDEVREGDEGHKLSDDQAELIAKALQTIERAQDQIENLMRFAGMIEADEEPDEVVDLNDKFRAVRDDLRADILRSEAVLEVADLPSIRANRAQILLLCQNLVANAIKYAKPGRPPHIRIGFSTDDTRVSLQVTDDGMGIPLDQQERIFEMFRRLQRQDQIPGTGLGLSVCRRVARNLGGELSVTSAPGEGSTFTLTIPIERLIECRTMAA